MISRFDHAVVAVPSLDSAVANWRDRLGFDARPGGRHTGRGTHNAIVRFGLDYIELISIYDRAEVEQQREGNALALARELDEFQGGLIGFALASDELAGDAARMRDAGLAVLGPAAMERRRPDGTVLKWRLLVPEGGSWRTPLPFFIQWDLADADRLRLESTGAHASGARAVVEIAIVVADLDAAAALYERLPGIESAGRDQLPGIGAVRARFRAGTTMLDLLAPAGDGDIGRALAARSERPWQLTLATSRRQPTADAPPGLVDTIPVQEPVPGRLILPREAFGARIVFADGA